MIERCSIRQNGFYGKYAPAKSGAASTIIVVTDDDVDEIISKSTVKWLNSLGVNALAVSPEKGIKGVHSYPMEQLEQAVNYLKAKGERRIGALGISASGMVALTAAALFQDITLTIALTPSDYVMEGYYQDKKDGVPERPGDYESSLTWRGKPLPFLPYAYRGTDYWAKLKAEAKRRGDMIAGRDMFDESERLHPLTEEEAIKVEKIHGHIYFAAAEDDVMWPACKYIRRMEARLNALPHECTWESHLYEHGTHFVFPEGLARKLLPFGVSLLLPLVFKEAKGFVKECRETRRDIDRTLVAAIRKWETA